MLEVRAGNVPLFQLEDCMTPNELCKCQEQYFLSYELAQGRQSELFALDGSKTTLSLVDARFMGAERKMTQI